MKQRSLWFVGLMSIFTLGIYSLYWLYVTKNEMNEKYNQDVPTFAMVFGPFIGIFLITPILLLGVEVAALFWLIAVPSFLIVTAVVLFWIWKYCQAVEKVTKNGISGIVAFIVFFFADDLAPIFIQHYFNKTSSKD